MNKGQDNPARAARLHRRAERRLRERRTEAVQPRTNQDTRRLLHELQVHQIELEMQNEELLAARKVVEEGIARYADLYDFAPVGYFTLSPNGTIRQANLTGARLLGVGRAKLAKRRLGVFVSKADRAAFAAFLEKVFAGGSQEACEVALESEEASPASSKGPREASSPRCVRIEAVVAADGRACRAVMVDITADRKMRDQFAQAQKMEAIGQLAGGIAHDFRNQLTVIKGYGDMLLRRSLVKTEGVDKVREILKAVDRSATISGQLLAFSRQQMLRPEVVSVGSAAGDLMKSLAQTLGEDVRVSITAPGDAWSVRVDVGQFQQALLNLVLNARDAMPKGGQLTAGTENVVLDENRVRARAGASAGRYVVLTISDTGTGMDPKTLSHLFEPFFTTKPAGEGTGLGLAMVHGFVAQSGGFIEVESQPGQGTTFRLYFPAADDVAGSAKPPSHESDLPRGSGTILVVEDEEAIRRVLVETLGECGYTVLAAGDAEEATALIDSRKRTIRLLITDVVMPGLSGPELAKHFHKARPGAPVLLISGHTGKMLTGHGTVPSKVNLLIKPFSSRELAETVRKALERSRPPRAPQAPGHVRLRSHRSRPEPF